MLSFLAASSCPDISLPLTQNHSRMPNPHIAPAAAPLPSRLSQGHRRKLLMTMESGTLKRYCPRTLEKCNRLCLCLSFRRQKFPPKSTINQHFPTNMHGNQCIVETLVDATGDNKKD